MKGKSIIVIGTVLALVLIGSIGSYFFLSRIGDNIQNQGGMGSIMNSRNDSSGDSMMGMEQGGRGHVTNMKLRTSTEEENPLNMPQVLKPDKIDGKTMSYTVVAKEGESQFFADGDKTQTLGYNGNYLGPIIKLEKGKTVTIRTINHLSESTTFHWHGLVVPSHVDGGPHQIVKAGETKYVTFKVEQNESTLWFHPHPMGKTASQVYKGLAGLLYIKDPTLKIDLPEKYGENDIPLILQDRQFKKENSMDYNDAENPDGVLGDTLVVNGTINPYFEVRYAQIRVRLLNGSNARNYVIKLSDGAKFTKIADDGGYLPKVKRVQSVALSPGERTEVLLDFSKMKIGEEVSLETDGISINKFKLKEKKGGNAELSNLVKEQLPLKDADFEIDRKLTLFGMGKTVEINGKKFDGNRIDINAKQNTRETWGVYNKKDMMGGMTHPFHVHGVQFVVLERDGKRTNSQDRGLKDTVAVKPGEYVKIRMIFKEKGVFMYHCHILEHEENGMMGQLKVD